MTVVGSNDRGFQINENLYRDYTDSLLRGDRFRCSEQLQDLIHRRVPVETVYINLFRRSLYEIGELWERNIISVSHEHLATAITERLMNQLYPDIFEKEKGEKSILVSCVPDEYHQIGAKMVADIFQLNKWNSYFLGANTPATEIVTFIQEKTPTIVALSLSIYFNIHNLKKLLSIIRGSFKDINIIVGGQAFRWGGTELIRNFPNTVYVPGIEEMRDFY